MALNFPNTPTDGQSWVDPSGQTWIYNAANNSWTAKGAPAGGMVYKGGIDITAAPPAGAQAGWLYTVTTGGTANAGFTGLTGTINAGAQVVNSGANWQQVGTAGPWIRSGTAVIPANSGDALKLKDGTGTASVNLNAGASASPLVRDSSGRLGLGSSTANKLLQVGDRLGATNGCIEIANENGSNPNDYTFLQFAQSGNTDAISLSTYRYVSGGSWYNDLRFNTDGTAKMTLTAGGSLGIGDNAPGSTLTVKGATGITPLQISGPSSEFCRVTSDGKLLVGTSSGASLLTVSGAYGTTPVFNAVNTTSGNAAGIASSLQTAANNTSSYHFFGSTLAIGNWYLYGNGTSSWSSDQRLKKDIETTRDGYLEDVQKLRVVKYKWRNGSDQPELGLVAQEVEQVFPGLVQDDINPVSPDDPTRYKQLKGSVLPVILLKALQEAATKIEILEAKVADLEGV